MTVPAIALVDELGRWAQLVLVLVIAAAVVIGATRGVVVHLRRDDGETPYQRARRRRPPRL